MCGRWRPAIGWLCRSVPCLRAYRGQLFASSSTSSSMRLGELAGEGVLLARVVAAEHATICRARRRPQIDTHAVAEPRQRAWQRIPGGGQIRQQRLPAEAARDHHHPQRRREQLELADQPGPAGVALVRSSACSRAARSEPPRPSGRRSAAARRRRCTLVGLAASPARCSAANSQSPLRSPVKMRPVRLPPCAAGASPTITIDALADHPSPGSDVPSTARRRTTGA